VEYDFISGYHIREAGIDRGTGSGFFYLCDGIAYVGPRKSGLEVDEFAPRLSFFFNAIPNLLEEVAKYGRAAVWAGSCATRFGSRQSSLADAAV